MTLFRPLAGLFGLASALLAIETAGSQEEADVEGGDQRARVQVVLDALPETTTADRVHSAAEGPYRVSSMFRSERGLDRSAREALAIVAAVGAASANEGEPFELFLAETPVALREALGDVGGGSSRPIAAVQAFRRGPFPAVAIAPRVHDRTLFLSGLPPTTRRLVAFVAARALQPGGLDLAGEREGGALVLAEGRLRLAAEEALRERGAARSLEEDPYTSFGLLSLRRRLESVGPEQRAAELCRIATPGRPTSTVPWQGGSPLGLEPYGAAVMLLAAVDLPDDAPLLDRGEAALERLDGLRPRWIVEGGAVGAHPFGWHAVATRRRDALVLSAEPVADAPFTMESAFVLLSNDLQVTPQADFVIGDQDGDRLLLACNAKEGLYLFRRAGPTAPYEILAENVDARPQAGQEFEVRLRYDGEVLHVDVGGAALTPVRLGGRSLAGRWGFGAHAGSTALIRSVAWTR
ncbi:MAG: hypothetical protein AAGB93_18325 [Planctomycetota bacterium]